MWNEVFRHPAAHTTVQSRYTQRLPQQQPVLDTNSTHKSCRLTHQSAHEKRPIKVCLWPSIRNREAYLPGGEGDVETWAVQEKVRTRPSYLDIDNNNLAYRECLERKGSECYRRNTTGFNQCACMLKKQPTDLKDPWIQVPRQPRTANSRNLRLIKTFTSRTNT